MPWKKASVAVTAVAISMFVDVVWANIKHCAMWCGNRLVEFLSGHTEDFE